MSLFDPVEGVDYIFDRYAFLNKIVLEHIKTKVEFRSAFENVRVGVSFSKSSINVSYAFAAATEGQELGELPETPLNLLQHDSPDENVKAVIKAARVLYHPDRYVSQPDTMKDKAKATLAMIERAADILENPNLRPSYTERLLHFYAEDTRKVSMTGTPIAVLGEERFSLDSLLIDEAPDTSTLERLIAEHTQYDETKFVTAKQVYDIQPDNPLFRQMYRDALTSKFIYLELLEGAAWQKLGFDNKQDLADDSAGVVHADAYLEAVDAEIEKVKTRAVPQAIEQRMDAMRIGTATAPLLLTDQSKQAPAAPAPSAETDRSVPTLLTVEQIEKITAKASEQIGIRAEYIRDVARRKQETLQDLCKVSVVEYLAPINHEDPVHHIVSILPGKKYEATLMTLQVNLQEGTSRDVTDGLPYEMGGVYDDAMRARLKNIPNLHVVRINNELSSKYTFTEALMLFERLHEAWGKRPAPAAAAVPALTPGS